MKKITAIILALIIMLMSLASCGKSETKKEEKAKNTKQTTISEEEIEKKERAEIVEITIPANYFGENSSSPAELTEKLADYGFTSVETNDDGSTTYKISKWDYRTFKIQFKKDIEKSFDDLVEAEETPSIKAVKYDDDFYHLVFTVDKESETFNESLTILLSCVSVELYRLFMQIDDDAINVVKIDSATGEEYYNVDFPLADEEETEAETELPQ